MRYARGVGGAAAREIKALYQPATWLIESINWRAGIIPIRENADWYARGVGGAAAREIKALYQPATGLIESMNWRAGITTSGTRSPRSLNEIAERDRSLKETCPWTG